MEMESQSKTSWALGIGALIVVLLGGWLWWSNRGEEAKLPADTSEYSVYVRDQRPATVAVIDRVVLKNGGYVAVFDMANGEVNENLGVSYWLPAGESLNVPVTLSRETKDKEQLMVLLIEDTDGDKKYVEVQDGPVVVNGENVKAYFTVDASLPSQYDSKL